MSNFFPGKRPRYEDAFRMEDNPVDVFEQLIEDGDLAVLSEAHDPHVIRM